MFGGFRRGADLQGLGAGTCLKARYVVMQSNLMCARKSHQ